ncbi:hypothetical protein VNO77_44032 [Canavalia gladiata]|uniref:TIR domain-containing protein n=1 Tax=Canavalia gladiata TaxID=3824 RepID=A0AAN9JY71_CANGL
MDRHRREFGMDIYRKFRLQRWSLILNRNFMVSRIEQATERKEKVDDAVLKWVDEAGKLLDEISEKIEKSGDTYYRDMIKDIKEMNGNRRFKAFSTAIRSSGTKNGILVILDDVPAKCDFDPEDIGIPSQRCKFLLTTRSEQDCSLIIGKRVTHCETMIPMYPLSADDAWSFLQKYSGIDKTHRSFKVAELFSLVCDRLPGTIIDFCSSFKDESYFEWQRLAESLVHSTARYQIFLSYEVSDTRNVFTIPLYKELTKKGMKTFMDLKMRNDADKISAEVMKAIEDSRLSIVVLSENYLASAWCLDELVHILECIKTNRQLVWPIFYKLEPKYIRHQSKALVKLGEELEADSQEIWKWKSALDDISRIFGFFYREGTNHTKFIQEVIDDVMEAKKYLFVENMDKECEEIESLNADNEFDLDSSQNIVNSESQSESSCSNPTKDEGALDPLLIALKENRLSFNSETLKELSKELQNGSINQITLHGKRGSGKTRLVEAVRDKVKSTFSTLFEVVLFATVSQNNIMSIQDQIARGLDLKFENESEYRRTHKIEQKLREMKRILVILDDVPTGFDTEKIIGIHCNDERCKFLFTARSKKNFPLLKSKEEIRRRKSITMHHLSAEEAWALLQEYSDIEEDDESSSKVLTVAKEIAFKYKWMPGAIVDLGSSLRGPCTEAMTKLKNRFDPDKIGKWKKALHDVCELSGWPYQGRIPQLQFIQSLVEGVIQIKTSLYIQNMEMV